MEHGTFFEPYAVVAFRAGTCSEEVGLARGALHEVMVWILDELLRIAADSPNMYRLLVLVDMSQCLATLDKVPFLVAPQVHERQLILVVGFCLVIHDHHVSDRILSPRIEVDYEEL